MSEVRMCSTEERDAWIAAARLSFHPGQRCPCAICDNYEAVTQAHHIIPLWKQWECGAEEPDRAFVWLCPTHHVAVHLFLPRDPTAIVPVRAMHGFPTDEYTKLMDIAFGDLEFLHGPPPKVSA